MGKFDDFIEVDDNETLFQGDQHLKINLEPEKIEKAEPEKNKTTQIINENEEDLIDTDEYLSSEDNDEPEDKSEPVKQSKEKSFKETDNSDSEVVKPKNEFSAFAASLNEQGFFPDIEDEELEEIDNEEVLQEKLAKQLNINFATWQDQYRQNVISNLLNEGYISKEDVKSIIPIEVSPEQIKSDINVAKDEIRRYYKRIGTPDKEIERIINSREDIEESALELNALNKKLDAEENSKLAVKMKQQEESVKQQRFQFAETLKQNTFAYDEFIPGRKLQKKDKEEVFDNIEIVLKKINSDLGKYAPLLSYLNKYGVLDGDFSKIIKEGKTQSVSQLEQILKDKKKGLGSNTTTQRTSGIHIDDSDTKRIYK
jgi:hypothetical protein